MAKHRNHSIEFKRQIAQEFVRWRDIARFGEAGMICRAISSAASSSRGPPCRARGWLASSRCAIARHVLEQVTHEASPRWPSLFNG
jgi:hypothetical protein